MTRQMKLARERFEILLGLLHAQECFFKKSDATNWEIKVLHGLIYKRAFESRYSSYKTNIE